jgi:hypothetical protein
MSEKSKLTINELVKYYGDIECPHCKGKFYLDRPDENALKAILYDQHIELNKARTHYVQACVQLDTIKKQHRSEIEALKTEIEANMQQEPPDGYWLISFGKLKNEHDILRKKLDIAMEGLREMYIFSGTLLPPGSVAKEYLDKIRNIK